MSARINRSQSKAKAQFAPPNRSPFKRIKAIKRKPLRQNTPKREAELTAKMEDKQTGKLYIINYVSGFRGMDLESEVFINSVEKTAALAAFDWMLEKRKGLDFEIPFCDLEEDELSAHVRESCNSFNDLNEICKKYGNSYYNDYNDYDGWILKFSQI